MSPSFFEKNTPVSISRVKRQSVLPTELLWDIRDNRHARLRREVHNENYKDKINQELNTFEWIEEAYEWHNKLRARHGSRPLELDYKMCYQAQKWAFELAERSFGSGEIIIEHDPSTGQGENIAARTDHRHLLESLKGGFAVKVWYKEIANHDWERNFYQFNAGHFTQVIWRASRRVGCGKTVSDNDILIVVCRYSPPGNYLIPAAYNSHVRPPNDGLDFNEIPDFKTL